MKKKFLLVFMLIFNLCHSMDTTNQEVSTQELMQQLPEDVSRHIFDIQIKQSVAVCQPSKYNDQKDLIRYILAISQTNTQYHTYINGKKYINKLFRSLPSIIKFPLVRRLLEKSFNLHNINNLNEWLEKFCIRNSALQEYCDNSVLLCADILPYTIEECEGRLQKNADPNFYIDLGHVTANIPPALINIASVKDANRPNSIKKLSLLLSHKADVNINVGRSFFLEYNGLANSCTCENEVTPLAVAIAYDNLEAVVEILKYKPKNLCFDELFLSKNKTIKRYMLEHTSPTQKDLKKGLRNALVTQNKKDIKTLLQKGAIPDKKTLEKTINRTLKHCSHPQHYKDYNDFSANPGSYDFRGYNVQNLKIPIPTTDLVQKLCDHGAYDEECLQKLILIRNTADSLIKMLETNKPQ